MDKRTLPVVPALMALLFLCPASVMAGPSERLNFGAELNAAQCDPAGGNLVINVVQRITGDIDSGVGGNYWAIDEYNRHIQVWEVGPGSFCAVVKYTGSFSTVAGVSPGATGTLSADVTGTLEGGYRAVITGTLKSAPLWKTKGNVGSYDYGCDPSNGTCTGRSSWTDKYFEDGYGFSYAWWGWTYHAGDNGSWVNSSDGNSGDITGAP